MAGVQGRLVFRDYPEHLAYAINHEVVETVFPNVGKQIFATPIERIDLVGIERSDQAFRRVKDNAGWQGGTIEDA